MIAVITCYDGSDYIVIILWLYCDYILGDTTIMNDKKNPVLDTYYIKMALQNPGGRKL